MQRALPMKRFVLAAALLVATMAACTNDDVDGRGEPPEDRARRAEVACADEATPIRASIDDIPDGIVVTLRAAPERVEDARAVARAINERPPTDASEMTIDQTTDGARVTVRSALPDRVAALRAAMRAKTEMEAQRARCPMATASR